MNQDLPPEDKFFHRSLDLNCIASMDGMFLHLNGSWHDALGYNIGDLKAKPFLDFIHPEDLESTLGAMEHLSSAKSVIGFRNRYRTKTGDYVWLQWSAYPPDEGEEHIYASARVISELVDFERKLEKGNSLLKAITDCQNSYIQLGSCAEWWDMVLGQVLNLTGSEYGFIGVTEQDEEGKFLRTKAITNIAWNAETEAFYKENAPAGLVFRNMDTLFGRAIVDEDLLIANNVTQDSRAGGRPDGHPPLNTFAGIPIRDENGMCGLMGIANKAGGYLPSDIDELEPMLVLLANVLRNIELQDQAAHTAKELESKADELADLNEELASANRMLSSLIPEDVRTALGIDRQGGDDLAHGMLLVGHVIDSLQSAVAFRERFLATMSHELRTPLNAILGLTEAIMEGVYGELTDGQSRGLETVYNSGHHLLSLINDVLDMSKMESGEALLRPRETTAERLCAPAMSMLRQLAEDKSLDLNFEDLSGGIFFECDQRRIQQVVLNLVGNALKFTEMGSVTVSVSFDEENARVVFDITDTGIGMDAEVLEKIFAPFYQVAQELNRSYEGTGLGLAITQRAIELHHGGISVQSTLGEGSCFTFWLPRYSPILDEVEAVLADL